MFDFQISVNPQPHFHPTHLERKQDLIPTNQNTRLTILRHPTSCILVPHHGRTHNNHPRRLKPPNHSKFTILDPFCPCHFAFPFGLPAVPYCHGGTQCPKTDFFINTCAKSLKQGAAVLPRDHNSDTAGSVQNPTVFSPIVLPLNPFQSFVLHGAVSAAPLAPTTTGLYPVPVNVWRTETFDKRAPGDISHTNTRFNSTKVFCRTATPHSTPLKTTHSIRLLLGRCNNPNNRWWTGSNRPRFTSFAYATALTKVRPPFCVPTNRVLHRICTGVPDPNFVYLLPSILCLPSPAVGIGRHRDFGTPW